MLSPKKYAHHVNPSSASASLTNQQFDPAFESLSCDVQILKDVRPASPSPRGVDAWGVCSPFSLPDPSSQLTFVEPEELSRLLEPESTPKSAKEEPMLYFEKYVLPKCDLADFDLFGKTELPSQDIGNILDPTESMPDLFKTSYLQEETVEQDAQCVVDGEVEELAHGELHIVPKVERFESDEAAESSCVNAKSPTSANSILDKQYDANRTQAEGYSTKHEANFSKQEEENAQADAKGKGKLNDNLTEEELKRIRRVKNRASVEKCRTKQRLRMEALQSEMEALTSENKALRDLTNWMDSSMGDIELQVKRLSCEYETGCEDTVFATASADL